MSILIGICGRTGSGKTSGAKFIQKEMQSNECNVGIISMDKFYKELSDQDHELALQNNFNFDTIDSFDLDALLNVIKAVSKGRKCRYKPYDHITHKCLEQIEVGPFDVVIFEGLYLFVDENICKSFDLNIFMEIDADESLMRRIRTHQIQQRQQTIITTLDQYERFVKPAYDEFVGPSKKHANIIIPRGAHNKPAMTSVFSYIKSKLNKSAN